MPTNHLHVAGNMSDQWGRLVASVLVHCSSLMHWGRPLSLAAVCVRQGELLSPLPCDIVRLPDPLILTPSKFNSSLGVCRWCPSRLSLFAWLSETFSAYNITTAAIPHFPQLLTCPSAFIWNPTISSFPSLSDPTCRTGLASWALVNPSCEIKLSGIPRMHGCTPTWKHSLTAHRTHQQHGGWNPIPVWYREVVINPMTQLFIPFTAVWFPFQHISASLDYSIVRQYCLITSPNKFILFFVRTSALK